MPPESRPRPTTPPPSPSPPSPSPATPRATATTTPPATSSTTSTSTTLRTSTAGAQPASWVRELAKQNRATWPVSRSLRAALAVGGPLVVGALAGHAALGVMAALGGLFPSVSEKPVPYPLRLRQLAVGSVMACLGYLAIALLPQHPVPIVLGITALALVAGVVSGYSARLSGGALQMLILATLAPHMLPLAGLWGVPAGILTGGAWAATLLAIEFAVVRRGPEHRLLATYLDAVGTLAETPPLAPAGSDDGLRTAAQINPATVGDGEATSRTGPGTAADAQPSAAETLPAAPPPLAESEAYLSARRAVTDARAAAYAQVLGARAVTQGRSDHQEHRALQLAAIGDLAAALATHQLAPLTGAESSRQVVPSAASEAAAPTDPTDPTAIDAAALAAWLHESASAERRGDVPSPAPEGLPAPIGAAAARLRAVMIPPSQARTLHPRSSRHTPAPSPDTAPAAATITTTTATTATTPSTSTSTEPTPTRPGRPTRPLPTRLRKAEARLAVGHETRVWALRLTLCMAVAATVMELLPGRSYWVPLTVAVVMKPDFGSVFVRGVHRGVGTILGAGLGTLLILVVPKGPLLIAVIVALVACMPWAAQRSYAMMAVFVTPMVVVLVDYATPGGTVNYAGERVLDTTIGSAIALLLGYLLWPGARGAHVPQAFARAVAGLADYLDRLADPGQDAASTRALRRGALRSLSDLRTQLQRSLAEPPPANRIALAWFPMITAAERLSDAITAELGVDRAGLAAPIAARAAWLRHALDPARPALPPAEPRLAAIDVELARLQRLTTDQTSPAEHPAP
ncbi:FUSC family protein [Serinibacter salmoneus]|uniref:Fusaric acid resistance family protein n=1 Tax=Serinibacter salmoneus TaxID=556530 RepID=A0A2A9CX89_9MICO|nr:FUSC family protein [Serinibacter salmoneus]PFG18625.1 fusaric acid resistance family protein [Serinibacter salmoneus]